MTPLLSLELYVPALLGGSGLSPKIKGSTLLLQKGDDVDDVDDNNTPSEKNLFDKHAPKPFSAVHPIENVE